ncbi:MAG: hypothetical protein ABFR82_14485 [Nitrospirota bacterium]
MSILYRIFCMSFLLIMITSCAYLTTKKETRVKSYTLNVEEQTSIDVPMITSEFIKSAQMASGHNLDEEQGSWRIFDYPTKESSKEELVYKGISDDTLHFSYKKYGRISTTPISSREITHNILNSDIMIFNNYRIKILNATTEYIRFVVLSD